MLRWLKCLFGKHNLYISKEGEVLVTEVSSPYVYKAKLWSSRYVIRCRHCDYHREVKNG